MADINEPNEHTVAAFHGVEVLTPRERCTVELHLSFFRFQLQEQSVMDFEVPYTSVASIFLLPKSNQPHAFVVVALNPPIRKDQTLYPHIVFQFENDLVVETKLSMDEDLLNNQYEDRLEPLYEGLISEVLAMILGGLSGARVKRPENFRSSENGIAVMCSLKTEGGAIDNGVMYPVETGFVFLPIPSTLILDDEIDCVLFERRGSTARCMHYFVLVLKLKNEQKISFWNIQKQEYDHVFSLIRRKRLHIWGLPDPVDAAVVQDNDGDDGGDDDDDDKDEDFVVKLDDGSSSTVESDASEREVEEEKTVKEEPEKEASTSKSSPSEKRSKDGDEDGSNKRKKRDPNAPKKAMTGFFFFSQRERDNVKMSNPGVAIKDVGRVLGEIWSNMTAEEKEPFETMARADKMRYEEAMAAYESTRVQVDSGNKSGSA